MNNVTEQMKKIIFANPEIAEFVEKNKIPGELLDRSVPLLFQHAQDVTRCRECMGKKTCTMDPEEYQSTLSFHQGNLERKYIKCPYLNRFDEDYLEMIFFPEVPDVEKLYPAETRTQVYQAIKAYNKNPLSNKGLYLYGAFGTGKTFICLKVAHELTKKKIKVLFVYYPDLVRHLKSIITTGGIEPMIKKLKEVPVLMLDDVGGETNTAYIRDEILGPILQYRMFASKPTFMTSNYSIEQLRDHFKETKDVTDELKSSRIIERISFMMNPFKLQGENYRRKIDK